MLKRLLQHLKDVKQGKTLLSIPRSPQWPKVEKEHLKQQPACVVCGVTDSVNVHHIFPFHYCTSLGRPDLELDQRNLITLCETNSKHKEQNHHLLVGHLDSFLSSNLEVTQDSTGVFKGMSAQEIESNPLWLIKKQNRLKPLHLMSNQDKEDFILLMNKTFQIGNQT